MNITSFNPLIVTKDAAPLIALFEALGFKRIHTIDTTGTNELEIVSVTMEDANGFRVDISQAPQIEKDIPLIRMNVPDFDEALAFLTSRGFTTRRNGKTFDTATNKSAMVVSPSGFAFDLCEHIKD